MQMQDKQQQNVDTKARNQKPTYDNPCILFINSLDSNKNYDFGKSNIQGNILSGGSNNEYHNNKYGKSNNDPNRLRNVGYNIIG